MNLPVECARLASWTNACLAGGLALDELAEHAVAPGQVHRVTGLPGEDAVSLAVAASALRRRGARRAWLVWPVPGDPGGLSASADVTRLATEAGQAVVVEPLASAGEGVVLVPSSLGSSTVVWTVLPAEDATRATTSLADADRTLKASIREATELLDDLEVARTREEDLGPLADARRRSVPFELGPGYENRARVVLDTAQRLVSLLDLAARDDGAAVSRTQADLRAHTLREVARASRHAFVAAVNSPAEAHVRDR